MKVVGIFWCTDVDGDNCISSMSALVHVREAIQYSDENKYPGATIGQGK